MSRTCEDVFTAVCAFIGESASDPASEPIRRRMPSLINAAVIELSSLDTLYRSAVLGEDTSELCYPDITGLSDSFPLCDRMLPVIAYHCAALAVRDENSILSDFLSDNFVRACGDTVREIPGKWMSVRDVYE